MNSLPQVLQSAFPKRPADLHKYAAGVVTIVGGSARFNNAPVISGLGARVAGSGLVQLVVPDASRLAAAALLPEATFMKQTPACVPPKADVMAIGMGLGLTTNSEMLLSRLLSGSIGRFVLDADALTILANWYAAKNSSLPVVDNQKLILTPHAGEAARLLATTTEAVQADRISAVRELVARYHAVVVLKGAHTLVAAPGRDDIFTCEAGNPFMAMGGMGDLLTGVIAARWATLAKRGTDDPVLAAAAAVWLHATASDALVHATPPVDPSIVHTAESIGSLRVMLERS